MLMCISELGCRALIEIAFESLSVRRQVGYLTGPPICQRSLLEKMEDGNNKIRRKDGDERQSIYTTTKLLCMKLKIAKLINQICRVSEWSTSM